MWKESISRLQFLIDTILSLLTEIEEMKFSEKNPEKWSKKEILGHLEHHLQQIVKHKK